MSDFHIPKICDTGDISPVKEDLGYGKILIIKPSSLGDILHAFPAFCLLKKSLPFSRIDWVVNSSLSPLLSYIQQDLNRIINFRRNEFRKTTAAPLALVNLIRSIRRDKYDLTIDMQGLMRSSMMTFVSRSRIKAGFAEVKERGSSIFYDRKVSVPSEITHAIDKNCYLISSLLGRENVVPDFKLPLLPGTDVSAILTRVGINEGEKYITFSPVARWITKTWPAEFFAKIADIVAYEFPDVKIALLGANEERLAVQKVVDNCRYAKPLNLAGETTLKELVEIIRSSELLLTNDSGPMHISAFVRTPVFALFGPTFPEKTGPYWQWNKVYQATDGCTRCAKRNCSNNGFECQKAIVPETVACDILKKLYML